VTHTRPSSSSGIYTAAARADGSETQALMTNTNTGGTTSTSDSFNANKSGVDIIIMVYGSSSTAWGAYTVKYNDIGL
jgi:hypothetical protein